MQRPINKEYCFVDFHATIDAIKYKVYHLTEKVKELYRPVQEKKDYYCPTCRAQWTQLEVLDKVGPMGFECHRCGGLLEREVVNEGDVTGHEKQTKLMSQLDGFINLLQKIDFLDVPSNEFEKAMSLRVVVERDRGNNITVPVQDLDRKKGAVMGTAPAPTQFSVSVIANTETTAAERAEEERKKAVIAEQNTMPIWHTTSTVNGASTVKLPVNGDAQDTTSFSVNDEEEDKKNDIKLDDELTFYYAQLAQEKAREAQEDQEAEEASGDDEDEFEDALGVGTPQESAGVSFEASTSNDRVGESAASGSQTLPNGASQLEDDAEIPASKKVKFEGSADSHVNGASGAGTPADKISDEDDEDDVEFEDV